MTFKSISAPEVLSKPVKAFSRGARISFGGSTMLLISGTASVDKNGETYQPNNFLKQAERTFSNISALLKSEGATWHDVVHTRCYLKSMKYYEDFDRVRSQFYRKEKLSPLPASVCVEAGLCRPELLVEIEVMAII